MPHTIFFSWQADTKTRSGRNFIERALTRADKESAIAAAIEEHKIRPADQKLLFAHPRRWPNAAVTRWIDPPFNDIWRKPRSDLRT